MELSQKKKGGEIVDSYKYGHLREKSEYFNEQIQSCKCDNMPLQTYYPSTSLPNIIAVGYENFFYALFYGDGYWQLIAINNRLSIAIDNRYSLAVI